MSLSQLLGDDDLPGVLLTAFSSRFEGTLNASINMTAQMDVSSIKEKLTSRERQLFDAGLGASLQWEHWKKERTRSRIQQSILVAKTARGQKRTRSWTERTPA